MRSHRFLVVLCLALFLAACASARTDTSTVVSPPAPTATNVPAPAHFQIGQTVRTGDGVWLITIVQTQEAPDDSPPIAGYVYLLLEVTMGNVSSQTQNADPIFYSLRDSVGNKYQPQLFLPTGYTDFSGNVASQAQAHGWLGFEVPPDQKTFLLNYDDFSNNIFWDIAVS